jgi:hypothetical protein
LHCRSGASVTRNQHVHWNYLVGFSEPRHQKRVGKAWKFQPIHWHTWCCQELLAVLEGWTVFVFNFCSATQTIYIFKWWVETNSDWKKTKIVMFESQSQIHGTVHLKYWPACHTPMHSQSSRLKLRKLQLWRPHCRMRTSYVLELAMRPGPAFCGRLGSIKFSKKEMNVTSTVTQSE